MIKRFLAFITAIVLLLVNLFIPLPVVHSANETTGDALRFTCSYLFSQMGAFLSGDLKQMVLNDEFMNQFMESDGQIVEDLLKESTDKDGKTIVTISPDLVNKLYDATQDALAFDGDYFVLRPNITLLKFMGLTVTTPGELFQKSFEFLSNYHVLSYKNSPSTFMIHEPTNYYYMKSPRDLYFMEYNPITVVSSMPPIYSLDRFGEVYKSTGSLSFLKDPYFIGETIKVYKSFGALLNHIGYIRDAYVSTNFYNYNVNNPVTVYKDVLNNNDWGQINLDMRNEIELALKNANVVTETDINAIIDAKFQALIDAMGSINGDINLGNKTLEEILLSITTSGNNQVAWLAKIYELLKTFNFEGGSGSGSPNDYSKQIEKLIELMEKNNSKLDKIVNRLDALILITGGSSMLDFLQGLMSRAGEVGDVAKTKFPTSIPWDVGIVVGKLASDPKVPEFELPLSIPRYGINETLSINLKDFEKLSKASRGLLSLTFILFMIILTRNLFGGDDK